jgi:hypothetical protein
MVGHGCEDTCLSILHSVVLCQGQGCAACVTILPPQPRPSLQTTLEASPSSRLRSLSQSAALLLDLLYISTSCLWWQTIAGRIGVQSSHALRMNSRRTWRHREDSRNVHNTAICRALRPLCPCGSVTVVVHGYPRRVAPIRHHTVSRDTPVAAHGRKNDPIASHAS